MKRKTIYLLQCIVVILLLACSEDDLQSLQAAFESDLQEVTIGESITFKDISTGEPSKWNWRFEGGEPETSILFSPNVVYNKPGVLFGYLVCRTRRRSKRNGEGTIYYC